MPEPYEVRFPEHFEEDAALIEAKGYLAGVEVRSGSRVWRPVFYDAVRLAQEVSDAIATDGVFQEPTLVAVERVTRGEIERAIDRLAARSAFGGSDPQGA